MASPSTQPPRRPSKAVRSKAVPPAKRSKKRSAKLAPVALYDGQEVAFSGSRLVIKDPQLQQEIMDALGATEGSHSAIIRLGADAREPLQDGGDVVVDARC